MYFNTNDEIITNYFETETNEKITSKEFILGVAERILENKEI